MLVPKQCNQESSQGMQLLC